ncbi:aspartyl protease family protein [Phenylobacterium soli]|uniref:Peptidase A2 domain-containing protein n=1 Tax=Phenylobacterium soli TaxID=2170551 RepID=A0A328ALI4_9CAUL|nr:aspartyl protease family protein [Phenylobacterium soli]RAK54284.1 hypothetical protein DJ017_06970 [Phenylobacterium soli]
MSLAALLLALVAPAPPVSCWFENGVVVVPAEVAGVAGDFILDTGQAQTILAETQAQGAGFSETALTAQVRLAGRRTAGVPVAVQDIDVRAGLFPTPIAGVIGADVLKAYVVDIDFAPCRVRLSLPARAPRFRAAAALPLTWIAGAPAVEAAVADGPHAFTGDFALATGSDTAVRLSDALAAAPGAAKPRELYPYGVLRPRLRALSFAGRLAEDLPAGLVKPADPALAGEIGAPLLAAWRVRLDFPGRRLLLAPNEKGPGDPPRP